MTYQTKRAQRRQEQRRKQLFTNLAIGGVTLAVLALLGFLVFNNQSSPPQAVGSSSSQGQAGEAIPVMVTANHVPEGTDPGPYNSNPPSSGDHYEIDLEPGFYEEAKAAELGPYPEGYLVHNLEHGYIIFWYNCSILDQDQCTELKGQIREVMDQEDNFKVIAFPWNKTDVPLVLTSWGRLQRFESFEAEQALQFVQANRNKAPEPMAD